MREGIGNQKPPSWADHAYRVALSAEAGETQGGGPGWSDPAYGLLFQMWQAFDANGVLPRPGGWLSQPYYLVMDVFPRFSRAKGKAEGEYRKRMEQKREAERRRWEAGRNRGRRG